MHTHEPTPGDDRKRYVRTPEAAAFLGAATQTLERWRTEGCGPPFVKLSNKLIVYDRADLVRFCETRKVSSTSERPA
jgi:predicted DNA-binding transcriptional regulator AlpA